MSHISEKNHIPVHGHCTSIYRGSVVNYSYKYNHEHYAYEVHSLSRELLYFLLSDVMNTLLDSSFVSLPHGAFLIRFLATCSRCHKVFWLNVDFEAISLRTRIILVLSRSL
jgi:hypothetical protein